MEKWEKAKKMVDDMTDIEIWKEIVTYYTQGEVTTIEEAGHLR